MSTYILVHGAWHGSWCWNRVRRALQLRGHEVFTPTLTGLAERSHLLSRQVDLNTHIEDVVNVIRWEEVSDVVLCGHSYGGAVISGVADRIPDRIAALVYLDAFVLETGQCVYDTLPVEQREMQLQGAAEAGDGWKVPPIPAGVFNVNARDRDWVNRQCTMQPIAAFEQPLHLSGNLDRIKNVTFVKASGWGPGPFTPFYERAKEKGWKTLSVPSGHDVMLDQPEELATALISVSAQGPAQAL